MRLITPIIVVDENKRTVIMTNGECFGIAKCDNIDSFDVEFGKKLAKARYYEEPSREAELLSEKIKFQIVDKKLKEIQLNQYGFYEYKNPTTSKDYAVIKVTNKNPILCIGTTYRIKYNDFSNKKEEYEDFTYTGVLYDGYGNITLICEEYGEVDFNDIYKIKVKKVK